MLLLIHCLLLPLFVFFMFSQWLLMQYLVFFLVCNRLTDQETAGCFALIVFLDFKCSVDVPRGVLDWSAVCDCGISWRYSLYVYPPNAVHVQMN